MNALRLPMAADANGKDKSNEDTVGLRSIKDICKEYLDIII